MNPQPIVPSGAPTGAQPSPVVNPSPRNPPWLRFSLYWGVLTLAFTGPLWKLFAFSIQQELHSHILLIPFITGYLIWLRRRDPHPVSARSLSLAVLPLAMGLGFLKAFLVSRGHPAQADELAFSTLSYLCFLWAGAIAFLGARLVGHYLFPGLFLFFLVPMPTMVENALEVFFQHTSAEAAAGMFGLTGTTFFREGLVFHLPGISIRVAQECSGIRSSLVLFITSLLAGHLFLKSASLRSVLTLFVIPLGIVRNGFRIWTLSMLCIHVNPNLIDSPIHHRGGPIFFILSLIPFSFFLLWLIRLERKQQPDAIRNDGQSP